MDITEFQEHAKDAHMVLSGILKLDNADAIEEKNCLMEMFVSLIAKSMKKELGIIANVNLVSNSSMENVMYALPIAIMSRELKAVNVFMAILKLKENVWLFVHLINTLILKLTYVLIIVKIGEKFMLMENVSVLMDSKNW